MKNILTVGIAGGSGSGKTTLTHVLAQRFPAYTTVLNHDDYYTARDDLSYEERAALNYDEPDAFDNDLFCEHLEKLRRGHDIQCPVYDYSEHNRTAGTKLIPSRPLVLVDGILIFADPKICNLLDLRVFVDTDADIRILRRLMRDVSERGRTIDSVIDQYQTTVKPMH
ncbi:MAG: uridine kinase, partial [Clostridia bacterium]|nr:uridine kinase [Clostridia bacterium]